MNRKIGVGVLWNLASLFMMRGASILILLFLTRMLAPESFGLIAMATIVFELANSFINSGLGTALIRSKTVSDQDLNTVFYTNVLLSSIAYCLIFIAAPYIANFYNQPELSEIIQVMGIVVFLNAAKIVQISILSRNMDFKSQMKANTSGVIISGVLAVTAALYGFGVWSLVIQMLSGSFISAFVLWGVSKWRPKFEFSFDSLTRLFSFGKNLLIEGFLDVLFQNSYILVIGRFFSAEVTGLYFIAKKISHLISQQLTQAVQQATLPALSTLQDDNDALKYKNRKIMQLMLFIIAPMMGLLAGLSPIIFNLSFDEEWAPAVPYFQLLCIVGALYPIHALNMNLLNVKGRSDLILKVGLLKKSVNLTLLFLAIPYGVYGIVLSQVLASILALIPNAYFSFKLVGYSLVEQVQDVLKPLISGFFAGFSAWLIIGQIQEQLFLGLIGAGLIGSFLYLTISYLIRSEGLMFIIEKMPNKFNLKGTK